MPGQSAKYPSWQREGLHGGETVSTGSIVDGSCREPGRAGAGLRRESGQLDDARRAPSRSSAPPSPRSGRSRVAQSYNYVTGGLCGGLILVLPHPAVWNEAALVLFGPLALASRPRALPVRATPADVAARHRPGAGDGDDERGRRPDAAPRSARSRSSTLDRLLRVLLPLAAGGAGQIAFIAANYAVVALLSALPPRISGRRRGRRPLPRRRGDERAGRGDPPPLSAPPPRVPRRHRSPTPRRPTAHRAAQLCAPSAARVEAEISRARPVRAAGQRR